MHNIIGILSVSYIAFKINDQILARLPISTNIIAAKIIGCCFFDLTPEFVSHVPCGQSVCLVTLSLVKQAKFTLMVGFFLIVSILQF